MSRHPISGAVSRWRTATCTWFRGRARDDRDALLLITPEDE